jgi:hypothetical protein
MSRKRLINITFIIFIILSLPTIINLLIGNFIPSRMFKKYSIQNAIKSVVLSNYPEWKAIEVSLDSEFPNTSSNVSIETNNGAYRNSLEMHVTIVTDNPLTEEQISNASEIICRDLADSNNEYDLIKFSAYDFKKYLYEESFRCPSN